MENAKKKCEVNVINNLKAIKKMENKEETNAHARISCMLAVKDKDGKEAHYLGLLDIGCTGRLISAELVEKYKMKQKEGNGQWRTNAWKFYANKLATPTNIIIFTQFSRKRSIDMAELSVNPNPK